MHKSENMNEKERDCLTWEQKGSERYSPEFLGPGREKVKLGKKDLACHQSVCENQNSLLV
jgi:hypothetical protein